MAEALLAYPQLADLLGERHRIIGDNWQNACTAQLIARYLRRAVTVMARIDFSPAALRKDLSGGRSAAAYLYAAAELINHVADLSAASSAFAFRLNPDHQAAGDLAVRQPLGDDESTSASRTVSPAGNQNAERRSRQTERRDCGEAAAVNNTSSEYIWM